MSELPSEVLAPFLAAYNAETGGGYALKQVEPREDGSCDYLYADPRGEQMKVQFTRARLNVVTAHPTVTPSGEQSLDRVTRSIQAWANHPIARLLPTHHWGNAAGPAVDAVMAKAKLLRRSASELVLVIFYDFHKYYEDELPSTRRGQTG